MARDTARPEVDRASSPLDAWDEAILRICAEIRRAPSLERVPCTLRIGSGCLRWLDDTLAKLPRREDGPGDDELWALRSAAIEVATRSYIDGVRARHRGAIANQRRLSAAGDVAGGLDTVVCALPPDLLSAVDELTGDGRVGAQQISGEHQAAARSVVVEAAVTAWLMLRGYPRTGSGRGRRGWWATLRHLLRR